MLELTRTLRQWWATAHRLEHCKIGRPDPATRIRWAFPDDPLTHPDTKVTVRFVEADVPVVLAQVPLTVWWMPASPGWRVQPSDWGRPRQSSAMRAEDVVAAAETIIHDHQRRRR